MEFQQVRNSRGFGQRGKKQSKTKHDESRALSGTYYWIMILGLVRTDDQKTSEVILDLCPLALSTLVKAGDSLDLKRSLGY